ncbi:MAG: hypothetical protein AAF429_15950 [Pseudomonadota bacterium]
MPTIPAAKSNIWIKRLILLAIFFALVRNLFPPNAFTATVLIFDYELGIVRRGLVGEIGNLFWGDTVSKAEVFIASALVTIVGVVSISALFWRNLAGHETGLRLLLVIVTCFAFDAIISATGYLDLIILALLCAAFLPSPRHVFGLICRIVAVALAVIVHEVALPYVAVFLLFDLWHARRGFLALLPIGAALAIFGGLTVAGQLSPDQAQTYIAHIEAKSEFTAEPDATAVVTRTLGDNMAMMAEKRRQLDYRSWVVLDGIPLALLSFWVIWLNLKVLNPRATLLDRLLLLGAIVAPLSLNVIAFDIVRFGAMSVLIGFFTLLVQVRDDPEAWDRLRNRLTWPHVVILLVINLNVSVNQMNTGDAHEFQVPWALLQQFDWVP